MTIGNRAIGAPINIWNDHQDSLSMRDAGWIQLYAETNQEAVDMHIQAFRLAEELSVPVMVCMDGFILTHAYERVDIPAQEQVDAYLPPFAPRQILDPANPVTIGAMVGPEAFMEVRYLAHYKQMQALGLIPELAEEFEQQFGRDSGGLVKPYRSEDAGTIIVALGSVNGTIKDVVDEMRDSGVSIGSLSISTYRPFPHKAVRNALKNAQRVVVVEKSLALGIGGIVATDVQMAIAGLHKPVHTVIAGLGGRPITRDSLRKLFHKADQGYLMPLQFLDLKHEVIHEEIARMEGSRLSGPTAENILKDTAAIASQTRQGV
jgi:pyruvate ferredoxin oxidoreductase alpha subunit